MTNWQFFSLKKSSISSRSSLQKVFFRYLHSKVYFNNFLCFVLIFLTQNPVQLIQISVYDRINVSRNMYNLSRFLSMIELYNAGLSAIISQYQQFVNKTSSLVKISYLVPIYPTTYIPETVISVE